MKRTIRILLATTGMAGVLYGLWLFCITYFTMGTFMPIMLGAPLVLASIFYDYINKIFKWILIIGYSIFIITFIITSSFIASHSIQEAPPNADAVIILGAGLKNGNEPSLTLLARIHKAMEYVKGKDTIYVLSGGQGPSENITEAEAMRRYLLKNGVREEQMIIEDKSRSTFENFKFSKILMEKRFGKSYTAVFATSDFHVYRAGLIAKETGLNLQGIGSNSLYYLVPSFYLREYLAVMKHWIIGG